MHRPSNAARLSPRAAKGIPRRLEALERLLERDPDLRDGMRYIQVAVPSRGKVDSDPVNHVFGTDSCTNGYQPERGSARVSPNAGQAAVLINEAHQPTRP